MQAQRHPSCDRARTWLSLRLDGEISELEGALLDAHLLRCDGCLSAAAAITSTTAAIRSAPAAAPAPAFAPPRRPGSLRAFYTASAATLGVAAVLTGLGSVGAARLVEQTSAAPKLQRVSAVATGMSDDLQLLPRDRLIRFGRPIPQRLLWPA